MCYAREGRAEVKQYYSRQKIGGGSVVGARFFGLLFGTREIGVVSRGARVAYSSTSVDVDDIIEALSCADESVLLGVAQLVMALAMA